jgi:pimeloyl-ACP methyl ester carboxylesterase
MDKPWLVFGGWAVSPEIIRPVFGKKSIYIDINEIIPLLIDNEELSEQWPVIVQKNIDANLTIDIAGIAGWSTGAIIACALAQNIPVKRLVLLSGTPSFCRREGFRFGWRPAILQSMRKKLGEKDNTVVCEFLNQSGIKENDAGSHRYDEKVLSAGLMFLEKVNLLPHLKKAVPNAVVLHGKEDKIVPYQAGAALAGMIGADFVPCNGGHAFFLDQAGEIIKNISGG